MYLQQLLDVMNMEYLEVNKTYADLITVRAGQPGDAKQPGRVPIAVVELTGVPVTRRDGSPLLVRVMGSS